MEPITRTADQFISGGSMLDRTGEFLAQSNLVKPSLLPAMAEESLSAASAVISCTTSAAPEMIERTLETGALKFSRGGSRMFGPAASKTSSRIIERNGNCS
jgi:hypothetical protein